MYLTGPKDAKESSLSSAARALSSRCKTYGYQGVTAKVIDRNGGKEIQLSISPRFTKEMQERIQQLSALAGKKVEYRVSYTMTAAQKEQYSPKGSNLKNAPKGAIWYWNFSTSEWKRTTYVNLLRTGIVLRTKDLSGIKSDNSFGEYYEVSSSGLKKLKGMTREKLRLVVDGQVMDYFAGWFGSRDVFRKPYKKLRVYGVTVNRTVESSLKHPLPFPLRVVK